MVGVNARLSQFKDIRGRVPKLGDKIVVSTTGRGREYDLGDLSVMYVAGYADSRYSGEDGCATVAEEKPFTEETGPTYRVYSFSTEVLIIEW